MNPVPKFAGCVSHVGGALEFPGLSISALPDSQVLTHMGALQTPSFWGFMAVDQFSHWLLAREGSGEVGSSNPVVM